MSGNPSTKTADTTMPVSSELLKEIRIAKAESGISYEDYLRENLSLPDE